MSVTDVEREFLEGVLATDPGTNSIQDLRYAYYISALDGTLPGSEGKVAQGVGMPTGVVTADPGTLYVDTAATNGAGVWRKASGTGNTGWVVVEGDTGWRNVAALLSPGWTGVFKVKREGNLIIWAGVLTMPSSGIVILTPTPVGFKVSQGHIPNILGRNANSGEVNVITVASSLAWGGALAQGSSLRFEGSYVTTDAWPTTLPGTPA